MQLWKVNPQTVTPNPLFTPLHKKQCNRTSFEHPDKLCVDPSETTEGFFFWYTVRSLMGYWPAKQTWDSKAHERTLQFMYKPFSRRCFYKPRQTLTSPVKPKEQRMVGPGLRSVRAPILMNAANLHRPEVLLHVLVYFFRRKGLSGLVGFLWGLQIDKLLKLKFGLEGVYWRITHYLLRFWLSGFWLDKVA